MNKITSTVPTSIRLKGGRIVKVITSTDSEQSRQMFGRLNVHKSAGVVRMSETLTTARIVEGGADTDVVNTKLAGPTNKIVNDGGGRRMGGARVHVVFWGDQWLSVPAPNPSLEDVLSDIESILGGPYLDAVAQYNVTNAPGGFAILADAWIERRGTPDYEFTMVDVNYEAWLLMTSGPIDDGTDSVVCIVMPPGATPREAINGQHSRSLQPNLNWVPTMWVKFDSRPKMSTTFSHELVETITDPDGDGIQIEPTGIVYWNEVADVCENIPGVLNGVTVISYWSAQDNSCVIPRPVTVQAWQIMCIKKRGERDNPNENIDTVGGIHIPSGAKYWLPQKDVITRIENGDSFFVVGSDGKQTKVVVRTHFPAWAPQGSKFITTVADDSKADNLLSLPDCGRLDEWNP